MPQLNALLHPNASVIHQPTPWDMAGAEGREVAQSLFGDCINQLAAFQSLETSLEGEPCGVLRLCDRNFRISYPGPLDQIVRSLNRNVWIQQFPWLAAASLSSHELSAIAYKLTARPPHRLINLPENQAVPVQINSTSFLLWRRNFQQENDLEIHTARCKLDSLMQILRPQNLAVEAN